MKEKTPLLVICGPTACGKTALSIHLAKIFGGEVVSADSMQIYKYMDIGTAKPTDEEMDGVPHHLIDFVDPRDTFSVVDYVSLAKKAIEDIHGRDKLPVLAGGTGLYIHSLIDNVAFSDIGEDSVLRSELSRQAKEEGNEALWNILRQADPELAQNLHPNNLGRVIRGIEVFRLTGIPLSEWHRRSREKPGEYDLCIIGLAYADREKLYQRINHRVDLMIAGGLLEEAESLFRQYSKTAAQAIGYKELFAYFQGDSSLEEAVEKIKRETRRYAKRQMTWLRRDKRIQWLNADEHHSGEELFATAEKLVRDNFF